MDYPEPEKQYLPVVTRRLIRTIFKEEYMEHTRNAACPSGAVYGLGLIGAAIWFISHAAGFWMGVLGFLKAIVWPVFLVYGVFKHIGM